MNAFGKFAKAAGVALLGASVLWGFVLCLGVISKGAGFFGILAGLFLSPVTFLGVPLYAGFACNEWLPFVLNYGASFLVAVLIWYRQRVCP